jgi:hypothetical protein
MRRVIVVGTLVVAVVGLGFLGWSWSGLGRRTIPVEPGTEQTFEADRIGPGDRFTCHGFDVDVQSPGFGFDASDGLRTSTALDGSVTIFCPEELEPL